MSESSIENQIIEELNQWEQSTEEDVAKLDRDVNKWNQIKETKNNLWELKNIFLEKWTNWEYIYKLDVANNYLRETSTSIKKIKEALFNDRKKIITAVQIALCKAWYLPEWQIDWKWWPITRGAVDKFQRENWLWKQKNPWYLNVNTLNKLIEVSTKKEVEKNKKKSKKAPEKKSPRKQFDIPAPDNRISEQPDKTRVAKKQIVERKEKFDLKKAISSASLGKIEKEKKWWTMDEVWSDIVNNVWIFREWHNWDYRFSFYDNGSHSGLPSTITVCGEKYEYNWDKDNLNWLWFETYGW